MCATVDDSEVITVVCWSPYCYINQRAVPALGYASFGMGYHGWTCCEPSPTRGEDVVLRHDKGVYRAVVAMCSSAAQWHCDWCTRVDDVCHLQQVSQLKMCDFSEETSKVLKCSNFL